MALCFLLFFSCSTQKQPLVSSLKYDILFGNDYGGASFQFYEIITEQDEFTILLTDDMIKPYVKKDDIEKNNFILINLGEKKSKGYTIKIQKIEERSDKIILTIKEIEPKGNVVQTTTNPCFVLKVKSKKPIEINGLP
ncbi:protease complex subunit PrcB family protein [Flavobacterium aciduliphilum]|uniref:Protease stability complex PrcB-like protein n=1 Tax=Flavobacterium aciduliphilum TaxID=1101402 RepID=A0A328YMV4_9FLAO|nr:protease complex subunit PrcB family protein [Flavobacterium aciduliphilum]RAR75391.1 protease stability complex PrcB-like protein [Flavobacterium aciduliphilum]